MSHDPHAHDPHGHAAPADASHGPAELPPVPHERTITPAPEDYLRPSPGSGLLWPVVWALLCAVFLGFYRFEGARGAVVETEHAEAHP
jgi:hypothetical protein